MNPPQSKKQTIDNIQILNFHQIQNMINQKMDNSWAIQDRRKCITIANDTTGIIKCGPSQHIHMENIWLGNNNCLSQRTGVYVYKTTIQNITCQNVSICTVPFFSGCLSVPPNNQRVISCPEHTTINVHDVWSSMKHGCPAYNQIHKIYIRNFKIHCEGGVDCTIYNRHSSNILSLYFHCEGISTSLTNPMLIQTTPSFSREKEQSSITSRTNRLSRKIESLSSVLASTEITISEGNALTDKEKKPFPGGAVAGGIAGGIIILFVTFGVLLYRRKHIDCLQSKRNVPYESTTVRETNDRQYTSIELSPDTKHDKSDDGQFMGNTRQTYENAAHIMQAHAREKYYVSDLKQNVDYKQ
ncbi:unnamed protein product [Mytilus edulis]|uniref:Uncharacterized protein n=1 Tax=Mytilus edulis TaxID=6550 RepID=A0A8S3RTV2_MYTED|nr:unnamed protein product [Mytilus edulis]